MLHGAALRPLEGGKTETSLHRALIFGKQFVQEGTKMLGPARMTKFTQCFGFNLANPLARHVELFTHFFEGVVSIHIDTKTHSQNFGFSRRQTTKHLSGRFFQSFAGSQFDR